MSRSSGKGRRLALIGAAAAAGLLGVIVPSAGGYPRYRIDDLGGYCTECHGHFFDHTSPAGTLFPYEGKHGMHRNTMGAHCDLCHPRPGALPLMAYSAGTADNAGVGCLGCHGRDYGGAIGHSGAGLRRHHFMNGVTICAGCHPDDPPPLPEKVMPAYYDTPDTRASDPCNQVRPQSVGGENFSGDLDNHRGLDNDGDNQYDGNDADCGGCPWDCGEPSDGAVGVTDFLSLLSEWGLAGSACDFGAGGIGVEVGEFVELLSRWGPCP
ncbi:MAG: hypothetical protein ACYSUA_10820 [Planctomycetota bacterium]